MVLNRGGSEDEDDDEDYHSLNNEDRGHNFDDYEALLNLDDQIVLAVPDKLINQLPISKFTEGNRQNFSEDNKSCTVCMCQYELAEEFMILPCLHRFHSECIKEWFSRRNTCPNCKDKVMEHFEGYQGGARGG